MTFIYNLFSVDIFEQVSLYSIWLLLVYPIVGITSCCFVSHMPACFWQSLIVFTSAFNLSYTDLCKESTEDIDHVILQTVVFIAKIAGLCFLNVTKHCTCMV